MKTIADVMNVDPQWGMLHHAYGSATDIPALLAQARVDLRSGGEPGSAWFKLWSVLCHQGDVYSASYASVPHLVELARMPEYRGKYDPILLAASIELARLDGRGPEFPPGLQDRYMRALAEARLIAEESANLPLDQDSVAAYKASAVALAGELNKSTSILNDDAW